MFRTRAGRAAAIAFLLLAGSTEPVWMVWHAVHHLETNHHDHPTGPAWDDASHQASSVQIGGLPSGEDHPHLAFPILVRPEFKAGAAGTALPPRTMRWEMVGTVVRA
ncbi:MAG: hypothetical protein SGI84_05210, partial [Gemmatimonadota bacterium]|nr:hypothetical protein [Gemmatimonadota bacterium]